MSRVKINFPLKRPLISVSLPVRISDINYGGHLGNDALLSMLHEVRMQWLTAAGFTELAAGGHGLIMADSAIAYKAEAFYGDMLKAELFSDEITGKSFDLLYRLVTIRNGLEIVVAEAKTGMICFDYTTKTIVPLSASLRRLLSGI